MTGTEAVRRATVRLRAAGVPDPVRDARRLLAHALDLPSAALAGALPEPLSVQAAAVFECAVAARVERRPVAQIVGRRAFYGRNFAVSGAVLDPRAETETVVDHALAAPFARVLDLGTGSGCLLVTLLAERPAATGLGTDVSAAALAAARQNAAVHGVADRAQLLRSDWFAQVAGRFDLIVVNPPYIATAELAGLAPELAWEPAAALSPGPDALAAYRAIAAGAGAHLRTGGRLVVEVGAGRAEAVAAVLAGAGLSVTGTCADLAGRERSVAATTGRAASPDA